MQKYNGIIAKLALASILLIVLLSMHFSIWGGTYSKGEIEYEIHQEMQMLEQSNVTNNSEQSIVENLLLLLSFAVVVTMVLPYLGCRLGINTKNCSECIFSPNSLVALSVRLNN